MSNYFSDDRFYEVDVIFACRMNDFTIFVGNGLIPDCDEDCIVILDHCDFDKATKICCISLEKPEYYPHGEMFGLDNWILNKEEKSRLIEVLQSNKRCYFQNTPWHGLIDGINDYHGFFLPLDYPMPDYMLLPE